MNAIIKWWMTPELPPEDIFDFPLLQDKSIFGKGLHLISHWLVHPFKRRLARWYLKLLQRYTKIIVIGVTGSAGKSTTVQMIASILRQKGKTVATPPSIDPIFNVPNTILKCPPWANFLILEMSVEYPGEMDYYLWLAKPGIGAIINIYPTHTQFFGNAGGVFKEKKKLVEALSRSGTAVLNREDKFLRRLEGQLKAKIVWFGGDLDPLAQNAKVAMTIATVLNVDRESIKRGLESYVRPKHRFEVIKHKSGAVIFDDSYNSNPEALISTLSVFNNLAKKGLKIAVLGDMLELGELEEREHRRVGREVGKSAFQVLIGVGKASKFMIEEVKKSSKETKTYLVESAEQVLPILLPYLSKNTFILVKGSRSIGLDKLVSRLS